MSKVGISLKIAVTDIDKARLFVGKKAKYLDATVFVDLAELDQYGNSGMITQDVTKDEKAAGVKGNILGNCKVFWVENGQAPQQIQQGQSNSQGFKASGQQYGQTPQQQPQTLPAGSFEKVNPAAPSGIDAAFDDDIPF